MYLTNQKCILEEGKINSRNNARSIFKYSKKGKGSMGKWAKRTTTRESDFSNDEMLT